MTQVLKNRKGVTLVELLAVIVIMGIIAAIAVPAIGGLIDSSRGKAVEGNLVTIEEGARLYSLANPTATTVTLSQLQSGKYVDGTTALAVGGYTFNDMSFGILNGTITSRPSSVTATSSNGTWTADYTSGAWKATKS